VNQHRAVGFIVAVATMTALLVLTWSLSLPRTSSKFSMSSGATRPGAGVPP
jgi:hypothetical protein